MQRRANQRSRVVEAPYIAIGRIGAYGSSGEHRDRARPIEARVAAAALDALKERYGFKRFHAAGQSGGGHTVAALLQKRDDIGCAVMASAAISFRSAIRGVGRWSQAAIKERYDPIDFVGAMGERPGRRMIVLSDPDDRAVSFRSQKEFVDRVRARGLPILHITAAAGDEDFHGLEWEAVRVAGDCAQGRRRQGARGALPEQDRAGRPPTVRPGREAGLAAVARATYSNKAMNARSNSKKLIKGATGDWEVVIGMEVHAQVTSKAKLFSGASTEFGGEPNAHVSLVDAAMPGMLPVINAECVRQAVRTGLGLKAQINLKSVFDRKNYFYPDLPQGYQISQYKSPIVGEGEVVVDLPDGERIDRRHRAAASRAGRRQVAARPASHHVLGRSQPLRRRAHGDRVEAGHALVRRGQGLCRRSCAASCAISAPATATWRRATCAPT